MGGARDELEAAIEARRELGPAHEPELVEAFLDRIERRVEERRPAEAPAGTAAPSPALAIASLAFAIPLTAIAASNSGFAAVLVVWIGIVLVNAAHALRT